MTEKTLNEIDIWASAIEPAASGMPPADAEAILRWSFNEEAKRRMEELANRNGEGSLSESGHEELEAYVNVGQVIAILQAKARLSLQRAGNG